MNGVKRTMKSMKSEYYIEILYNLDLLTHFYILVYLSKCCKYVHISCIVICGAFSRNGQMSLNMKW